MEKRFWIIGILNSAHHLCLFKSYQNNSVLLLCLLYCHKNISIPTQKYQTSRFSCNDDEHENFVVVKASNYKKLIVHREVQIREKSRRKKNKRFCIAFQPVASWEIDPIVVFCQCTVHAHAVPCRCCQIAEN